MTSGRGVLTLFLAVSFIVTILFGWSDKLAKKPCDIGRIDQCARTGGMNR